jgi:hypothetical protein
VGPVTLVGRGQPWYLAEFWPTAFTPRRAPEGPISEHTNTVVTPTPSASPEAAFPTRIEIRAPRSPSPRPRPPRRRPPGWGVLRQRVRPRRTRRTARRRRARVPRTRREAPRMVPTARAAAGAGCPAEVADRHEASALHWHCSASVGSCGDRKGSRVCVDDLSGWVGESNDPYHHHSPNRCSKDSSS